MPGLPCAAPSPGGSAAARPARAGWLLAALALPFALPLAPARADWSRQTTQTVQQTTGNSGESLTLQRGSLNAVAASGIRASAPLIEQGQWNSAVQFSPALDGGAFSLLLNSEAAGAEASRGLTVAPNRLEGSPLPAGSLRGGPGSAASEVRLSIIQSYSVF